MKKKVFLVMIMATMLFALCGCTSTQDPVIGTWEMTYIDYGEDYTESDLFTFKFYEDNTGCLYFNDYEGKEYSTTWEKVTTDNETLGYIVDVDNGETYSVGLGRDNESSEYDTMVIVISDEYNIVLEKVDE